MSKKDPKKSLPRYLIIYVCQSCGQDCGYTEREKPKCRFCGNTSGLTVVSKQRITKEVMMARLKEVTDRMMSSLISAYEGLPKYEENIVAEGKDAEAELLRIMERVKKLRDKVQALDEGGEAGNK
ncbi:MAG TPA: hypothetical protein VF473_08620 [Cyclobacteriaceae bacterium]